jgi:ABC-type Fe3+ transport system permease subunit
MILNVYVSLEGIDKSLLEAARSLGCTEWQAFKEVTLPLSLPGRQRRLSAGLRAHGGTYLPPMILGGPGNDMIANLIFKRVIGTLDWPFGSAISVILLGFWASSSGPTTAIWASTAVQGLQVGGMKLPISGWSLIRLYTILVYMFMFLPIVAVILLSFNPAAVRQLPDAGLQPEWYVQLAQNRTILRPSRIPSSWGP